MRGAGRSYFEKAFYTGITPAYAGSSYVLNHAIIFKQDHPRVCGEQTKQILKSWDFI